MNIAVGFHWEEFGLRKIAHPVNTVSQNVQLGKIKNELMLI